MGEARKEPSVEHTEMNQLVEMRREFEISACIVRIMKARRQMKHGDLMLEVADQLMHRFTPAPSKVKGCISKMIEKEYMARAPDMM
jgi:Cullin protein neddylation domain